METDERDFIMTRELAYQVIKYADKNIPLFNTKVSKFLIDEFPETDIETDDIFDEVIRKMSDAQIEKLFFKME